MATGPEGSAFMTGESPAQQVVEERQLVGYRIRDTRMPEEPPTAAAKRAHPRSARFAARVYQLIDYCFMVLYGILVVRFLLALIAANEQAGFVRFIRLITQPFYGPFADIVPSPAMGEGVFDMSLLMCLLAYMMLHLALRGLLHVTFGARSNPES